MGRTRPERKRTQWADLRAATNWYYDECNQRGVPREEAIEHWEDLSITARIRRWKMAIQGKAAIKHVPAWSDVLKNGGGVDS